LLDPVGFLADEGNVDHDLALLLAMCVLLGIACVLAASQVDCPVLVQPENGQRQADQDNADHQPVPYIGGHEIELHIWHVRALHNKKPPAWTNQDEGTRGTTWICPRLAARTSLSQRLGALTGAPGLSWRGSSVRQ